MPVTVLRQTLDYVDLRVPVSDLRRHGCLAIVTVPENLRPQPEDQEAGPLPEVRRRLNDFIKADGLEWRSSHRRAMLLAMTELSKHGKPGFPSVIVATRAKALGDAHCSNLSASGVSQNLRQLAEGELALVTTKKTECGPPLWKFTALGRQAAEAGLFDSLVIR